ncbi:MAG: 3-hydroxyacyl-CoA dehydrogenase/enoyl-CoA hydratase family protein [Anaerolineae bacterium]|nr:MAG: 3-hydroxyacyl-CoA dehydrogenase/enoyl-CoA hydratase family protein [Anaerolineae bacterium]
MSYKINKVGIIGSGTMGSGIGALLAGIGVPVVMLDIPGDKNRNSIVEAGLKRLQKSKPAQLFEEADLSLFTIGNLEDDLHLLADCDWIVEVVVERLDIKQQLMEKLEKIRQPYTIITTNTSGLSINAIAEGRSEEFQRHFLGTHFFNPPRYLKLLEIIPHKKTDPALIDFFMDYGSRVLGKGTVLAKDTPNFIGNRFMSIVGMLAINYAIDHDFTVEEVDAITGPLIGHPKSATFRLNDVVGVDIAHHVAENLYDAIPDDEWREVLKHEGTQKVFSFLMQNNFLGSKTGQGFFKTVKGTSGEKEFWHLGLKDLEYKAPDKVRFESVGKHRKIENVGERIKALINESDRAAEYLWHLHAGFLAYASQKMGEITDDLVSIDNANKWGFGHELGPFEIWDAIGVEDTVIRMEKDGYKVAPWVRAMLAGGHPTFYQYDQYGVQVGFYDPRVNRYVSLQKDPHHIVIAHLKNDSSKVVDRNMGASLIDLGDGVALLEFHTKMNALDDDIIKMGFKALERLDSDFDGLVIGNDGENFSVGANIMLLVMAASQGAMDQVDEIIRMGQTLSQALRYAKKPVVTAPFGRCLGGGAEMVMSGWRAVAHAESYIGLVEFGVGLIPAWSGCKELLRRIVNPVMVSSENSSVLPHLQKVFEQIGLAKVSMSAMEARDMGFLTKNDRIVLNRDHLLAEAKKEVLALVEGGAPAPEPSPIYAAGRDVLAVLNLGVWQLRESGYATDYDMEIGRHLAYVLTGGDVSGPQWVSEQYILDLERESFLDLVKNEKTMARITHMLETGKPLRN